MWGQDIIIDAIREHRQLVISYPSQRGTFDYIVNPYILGELGRDRNISLHCFVLDQNQNGKWRNLSLSRIQNL